MKKEYIAIVLIIIAIVLGIIFYFNTRVVIDTNTLEYTAGCASEKIDASVYSLSADTRLIGALLTFQKVPLDDSVYDDLQNLGVSLEENSWVLDYTLAQIPTESLCDLADRDFVKYIFIPKDNQ